MAINAAKCFIMFISPLIRKKVLHNHQEMLANSQLITVKSMRILRGQFYDDLPWLSHSDAVRRKTNCIIGVQKRCGRSTNTNVRQKVYNLFIAPHLDYCLPIWEHLPKTSADRMEHCILRMLRRSLNSTFAWFLMTIYSQSAWSSGFLARNCRSLLCSNIYSSPTGLLEGHNSDGRQR